MRFILVLIALISSASMGVPTCFSDWGNCDVMASYYESTNTTYWTAACTDGSVFNGAIGGNELDGICGP